MNEFNKKTEVTSSTILHSYKYISHINIFVNLWDYNKLMNRTGKNKTPIKCVSSYYNVVRLLKLP